jgi:hypothetical protein
MSEKTKALHKTLYIGSYGHRYSDALGSVVGYDPHKVAEALTEACDWEIKELAGYCEHSGNPEGEGGCNANGDCEECELYTGGDCPMCDADVVHYGVLIAVSVADLGGLRNAKGILTDLKSNDVVHFGEGTY